MPKSIFQDMVKINSSRKPEQINQPTKRAVRKPVSEVYDSVEENEAPRISKVRERIYLNENARPPKKRSLWIVAGVAVVFFIFSLSYFFARAEVTIDPKIKDFTVNLNLSADQDGGAESLPYDIISISGDVSKTVTASDEKEVAENATGAVILYNNLSTPSQKLDVDTRLEGSNGKMYKTKKAVVIPGMVGSTPGSIEVSVYAAEAGVASNSEPLDFKIFGFKGGPKYEKFYGRSKGNLTGGFKGLSRVVTESDKAKALEELTVTLREKLIQKATDQIPAGFVLLKDAVTLDIDEDVSVPVSSQGNSLPLSLSGTLHGVLFEEKKLSNAVAEKVVSDFDNADVYISNINDLKFKLTESSVVLSVAKKIDFNLSGTAKIVWRLNSTVLTGELLGKSKSDFNQAMLGYPNVVSANLSLSPIWNRTIPDKASDIKIIVNYPIDASL